MDIFTKKLKNVLNFKPLEVFKFIKENNNNKETENNIIKQDIIPKEINKIEINQNDINTTSNKDEEEILPQEYKNKYLMFIYNQAIKNTSYKIIGKKIIKILNILNSDNINYIELQKIIFKGIPDDNFSLRSLIWKLVLNCISLNSSKWEEELKIKREKYAQDYKKYYNNKIKENDPLNLNKNSKWNKYFEDEELKSIIDKDIKRTKTHMHFFLIPYNEEKGSKYGNIKETNADVMGRILFIYGKNHSDIKYVQGMNEILSPIFYCFSKDKNEEFLFYLEEDIYSAFENLMNIIKVLFINNLDFSPEGIQTKLSNLNLMLKDLDFNLYHHLVQQNIEFNFFAFKWYTLLFTQDFEMPDILRLWDSILSQKNDLFDFINILILSILYIKKNNILHMEFSDILGDLQDIQNIDVVHLIKTTFTVRSILNNKI